MQIIGDQPNNATRIEETGYGFKLDLLNFTQEELADRLDKLLNDQALRRKWNEASKRIQKENRLLKVAEQVVRFVERL